jgi:hypothetical protein
MLTCTRSSAYPVYAKVLEDIYAAVRAINLAAYNASSRAPQSQRTGQRGNDRSGLDHSAGIVSSHTGRVFKRGRKPSHANATGKDEQVALALEELSNKNPGRRVGCPVHKHHVMRGTDPPCRGCSVGVMSQLRSHLNPSRASTHRGFPAFVAHCSCCEQDFVQEHVYHAHLENRCEPQSQIRNDIVLCWGRLYLALYPNARRIPSPWTNEDGWLPDSEWRRCHAPVTNSSASSSFLERHQSRDSFQLQTPPAVVNPPDDPVYNGVMDFLLQDVSTQRTIRQGATHFTEDQILSATRECERMYHILIAMYREQLAQSMQVQVHPATSHASTATMASHPIPTTPLQAQYLPYDHFATPIASTQPSTHGYATDSSRYVNSTPTQPSSTSGPRLLHPYSSHYGQHRGSSVPTSPIPETLAMRRQDSRFSLPEQGLNNGDEEADDFLRPPYYR